MKISQREARRLRKRVTELDAAEESRRRRWSQAWSGGVEVARLELAQSDRVAVAIRTANLLSHAVVALGCHDNGTIRFIALPHPKVGA